MSCLTPMGSRLRWPACVPGPASTIWPSSSSPRVGRLSRGSASSSNRPPKPEVQVKGYFDVSTLIVLFGVSTSSSSI
uniref:Predicted protein n=1 Tax=Hordeum vulgare subsp. vulgare TaxID=112509 RepID=F2EJM4_HORVV|nr:predicted protein [Hordeum vulgare subsp. vulgare]